MATYSLEPTRETLHGVFDRELPPILTIDPGDTVHFRTLDAGWGLEARTSTVPSDRPRRLDPRDPAWLDGHCLVGPVSIRGAEPGMTLEVRIEEVQVGTFGTTFAGGWPHRVNERLGLLNEYSILLWELDSDGGVGRNQQGYEVALRPFMGVMGMPPAEPGPHSTPPPRPTGGNLDCKELIAGTSLFLPIAVPGGLFSVGDGHAVQGDGEVSVTAIECPMERVTLTFLLHKEMQILGPRARTPDSWITLGLHEDLDEASFCALDAMLGLMGELHGLERPSALALASLVVDMRITQIVNGVQGVHAVLKDDAFRLG